ncbi:conjugal transfer protein TraG N-terminal domain-containing protein [Novosphingobium sp. 9U]|uniref:conjugal transfer protein TraG N-terminal domain-containing protein n=1 Tax=Novosphingobium sp. 9U TaxID=2653158 RepID=UPI0012EFB941|nr:conjugal transfer protein TraG N-terminal domain-containing protein [Novosphingobium sp. 9U]VWX49868.1 IncF plasmid conjugative transfer protein TraG [Novosphingobium sp. 9U]
MLEVFTIGGGEYIVNVLNAVAAWCGGGGFRSMLQVVMVMGLAYVLLIVAFTLDWRVWFKWFLSANIMYMCMLVPTTSVKVTDRINPSLAPAVVDNVPIGLAAIAAFSSQAGDWLTRTAETVFVMPDDLKLSTNGFIYGSRLYDKTREFGFRDARLVTNLEEYNKQCVFYDLLLGFKSMDTLTNSTDILTDMGPGSKARGMKYIEPDLSSTILTCEQGYNELKDDDIPMAVNSDLNKLAPGLFPDLAPGAARAKLEADIPEITQAFHGTGQSAANVFQQRALVEAFMSARANLTADDGDSFAALRADQQARNTYIGIAQQAMTWVPLLNIVLTVVFYAMFPVLFPLFLLPQTGPSTLKGYFTGFFYLASWGPLYVVLHMFIMGRTMSSMAAVAPGGLTMGTMSGIDAVNSDTATIAGFMLMSVPFIAAGMARGAMSIGTHATSMLAPAQAAAEAAAVEQTTGNYAYGNLSYQNLTANTRQTDQWTTSPNLNYGAAGYHFRNNEGGIEHQYADAFGGHTVYDTSTAISKLPWSYEMGESGTREASWAAAAHWEAARELRRQRDSSTSTSNRNFAGNDEAHVVARGSDVRAGDTSTISNQRYKGHQGTHTNSGENSTSVTETNRVGENNSGTVTDTFAGQIKGNVGYDVGRGGAAGSGNAKDGKPAGKKPNPVALAAEALGVNAGLDASVTAGRASAFATNNYNDKSIADDKSVRVTEGNSQADMIGSRDQREDSRSNSRGTFASDTNTTGERSGSEHSEEWRESLSRQIAEHERRATMLDQLSRYSESNGWRLNENAIPIIQPLYEKMARTSAVRLPHIDKVNLTPQERDARDYAIHKVISNLESDPTRDFNAAHGIGKPMPEVNAVVPTTLDGGPASPRSTFPSVAASRGSATEVAREHGVIVKPGSDLRNLQRPMIDAIPIVAAVGRELGVPNVMITSGNDRRHVDGSKHYKNAALDFRGNQISQATGEEWQRQVQQRLGSSYWVDFEYDPKEPANRHLHVQRR